MLAMFKSISTSSGELHCSLRFSICRPSEHNIHRWFTHNLTLKGQAFKIVAVDLFVQFQLALAPMMLLGIGIEDPLAATGQRQHDARSAP